MLSEHTRGTDRDCDKYKKECRGKAFSRKVEDVIKHELYDNRKPHHGYDIALLRVDEPIPLLFDTDPQ